MPISAADPLLDVTGLSTGYGKIRVLTGVDLTVRAGEVVALLGPNGAGKTTLFNCLSRLYTPDSGEITFSGMPLLAVPRHRVAALGIGRTFQNLALFRTMSVRRNILVGAHCRTHSGFLSDALRLPRVQAEERDLARRTEALMVMLGLESVAALRVDELPFGTRKRVELARALASEPRLLLLDDKLAEGRYRVAGEPIALDDIGADVQRDRLEAAQTMQRYWITGADSR